MAASLAVLGSRLASQQALVERVETRLGAACGEERLDLLWRKAQALRNVHLPTARDAAATLVATAHAEQRRDYAALGLLLQAACEIGLGHAAAAAALRAQATNLPAATDPRLAGSYELLCCQAASRALRLRDAVRHLTAAREFAATSGNPVLHASCLVAYHELLKLTNLAAEARDVEVMIEAVDAARTSDPLVGLDATRYRLEYFIRTGRDSDAAVLVAAALARAEAEGNPSLAWQVHSCLQWREWQAGRYARAVEHAERCAQLAQRLESSEQLAAALDGKAWSLLLGGQPESTGELIDAALERAADTGLPMLELRVLDSAVNLAIARQDKEALLRHAMRRKFVVERNAAEAPPGDREYATAELRHLLDEGRATEVQQRERLTRGAEARQLALLFGTGLILALAGVLFFAKRRVERVHRRLLAETERAKAAEAARQQLEQQMRHLERLDSVGLLAAGIAHDFNNLLTGIQGNAELLHERERTADGPAAAILTATQRAAALCRKMLDHTRPHFEDADVHDLRDIAKTMQPLLAAISSSSVAVELDLATTPVAALVDRAGIERALLNLCTNAVEASPPGSRVRVSVRLATGDEVYRDDGAWFGHRPHAAALAVLEVSDRGRGIAPEQLRRVFDPFFTTRFEGRGLGLSVAYGVVKALGGAFCVASRVGSGSRFSIYLPAAGVGAAKATPVSRRPAPASANPPPPTKVLVVDDEVAVQQWLERLLQPRGCTVLAAADGAAARRLFAAHPEAVVLLDVSMPGEDGPSLLAQLRQIRNDARVVVISGHDARAVRERFPADPPLVFLQKPFLVPDLLQAMARSA